MKNRRIDGTAFFNIDTPIVNHATKLGRPFVIMIDGAPFYSTSEEGARRTLKRRADRTYIESVGAYKITSNWELHRIDIESHALKKAQQARELLQGASSVDEQAIYADELQKCIKLLKKIKHK